MATYWDPNGIGNGVTLSEGSLAAAAGTVYRSCRSTTAHGPAGKWYFEITARSVYYAGLRAGVGSVSAGLNAMVGADAYGWSFSSHGYKYNSDSARLYGDGYTAGDVVGVCLDLDEGTLSFTVNGVNKGVAFTGLAGTLHAFGGLYSSALRANFGGSEFKYGPPAGYEPWGEAESISGGKLTLIACRRIEQITPHPRSFPAGLHTHPTLAPGRRVLDGYGYGRYRIQGSVRVNDVPASRRVFLLRRRDLSIVAKTWSDPDTGEYVFEHIAPGGYCVICDDYGRSFNAAVADWVEPEPM